MSRLVQVVEVGAGALLIVLTLADAIGTPAVARGLTARWRPTRGFYSAKSGVADRTESARPLGSSHSSWRPRAVRSRK